MNIGVLVSGGGTNLQALIGSSFNGKIVTVVSSNENAYALERAKKAGIPTKVIKKQPNQSSLICRHLKEMKVDLVVLAGFMCIIEGELLEEYKNRIINVHPSLIPSFCGKGFYGLNVHKAVLKKGVKITGATVHFVNEEVDGGHIILQKAVEVHDDDTPQTLQKRVMQQAEWEILPKAVSLICDNRIKIVNNRVIILPENK
jgi:phosphoribosylglycinamide formyltransferase-1